MLPTPALEVGAAGLALQGLDGEWDWEAGGLKVEGPRAPREEGSSVRQVHASFLGSAACAPGW